MGIIIRDMVLYNGKFYVYPAGLNAVLVYDETTKENTHILPIPEEQLFDSDAILRMDVWKDHLILLPLRSQNIWALDLDHYNWKKIERPDLRSARGNTIAGMFTDRDHLYIVGSTYPAILCFDDTFACTSDERPYKDLQQRHEKPDDIFFRDHYAVVGDTVYLASSIENSVLNYHLATKEYEWITVGGENNRYAGIEFDGEDFWLIPRRAATPIVKWDGGSQFTEIKVSDDLVSGTLMRGGFFLDGKLYVSAYGDGKVFYVDKATLECSVLEDFCSYFSVKNRWFYQDVTRTVRYHDFEGNDGELSPEINNQLLHELIVDPSVDVMKGNPVQEDAAKSLEDFCAYLMAR